VPPSPSGDGADGGGDDGAPADGSAAEASSVQASVEAAYDSADEDWGGEHAQGEVRDGDWQRIWSGCVHVLSTLASGQKGVLPICGRRMPDGRTCARTCHVIGGTIECAAQSDLAEGEAKRWRALREALKLRGDGTINPLLRSESMQREAPGGEGHKPSAADEKAAAAEAAANDEPPKPPPKPHAYVSNFTGAVRPNLNMVGYWSMPPKHRATSLRDARNVLGGFATNASATADGAGASGALEAFRCQPVTSSEAAAKNPYYAPRDESRSRVASPIFDPRVERVVDRVAAAAERSGGGAKVTEADALAAGWKKSHSKSHGRDFWHHKVTGRREWSLDKLGLDSVGSREGGGKRAAAHRDSAKDGGRAHGAHAGHAAEEQAKPKREEWKAYYSAKRQRTFYRNKTTGETTWTKPEGFVDTGEVAAAR